MEKIRCTTCKKIFTDNVDFEQHPCVKELEKLSTEDLQRAYAEKAVTHEIEKGRAFVAKPGKVMPK